MFFASIAPSFFNIHGPPHHYLLPNDNCTFLSRQQEEVKWGRKRKEWVIGQTRKAAIRPNVERLDKSHKTGLHCVEETKQLITLRKKKAPPPNTPPPTYTHTHVSKSSSITEMMVFSNFVHLVRMPLEGQFGPKLGLFCESHWNFVSSSWCQLNPDQTGPL